MVSSIQRSSNCRRTIVRLAARIDADRPDALVKVSAVLCSPVVSYLHFPPKPEIVPGAEMGAASRAPGMHEGQTR
jgi:hypothetical protein